MHLVHGHEDWPLAARLYAAGAAGLALMTLASIRRSRIPFVPFGASQLYVYYGLGIFGPAELGGFIGPIPLRAESLESASLAVLLCGVTMVAAANIGRWIGAGLAPRLGRVLPRIAGDQLVLIAVPFGIAMLAATYVSVLAADAIPGSLGFVAYTMVRPALGQGVLSAAANAPGAPGWLHRWFLAFTVGASLIGLSSGMLFPGLAPWVSHGVFVWLRRGAMPWRAGALVLLLFVVLNPAKHVFRQMVWWDRAGTEIGLGERFDAWQTAVASTWSDEGQADENVEASTDRLATLVYAAQAFEWVPSQVPHTGIDRWLSIPATYIPRFLWPDKPDLTRVNNVAYTTTFGLQSEAATRTTTVLFPLVFDGYWALGWLGILIVGAIVGVLLGAYETAFPPHDWAAAAIGVALLTGLSVHAHLGTTLTGVPQSIVGALVILWGATAVARSVSGRRDRVR